MITIFLDYHAGRWWRLHKALNTAFQFGAAVALAIASAVTQEVDVKRHHSLWQEHRTGMVCSAATAGMGLLVSVVGLMGDMGWSSFKGIFLRARRRFN